MTDLRLTQAPSLIVTTISPESRATQAAALAIAGVVPPVLATQAPVLTVASVIAPLAFTQAPVLLIASAVPCASRWAQIWTITRTDGEVYRFTSLDRDLEWGDDTYRACDSLVPSASEGVSELDAAGSMDLSGALGEGGIGELELFAGLFDGATAEAWLVPWQGAGMPRRLLKGTFGAVEHGENGFKVELLGDGAKLQQTPLVRLMQPGCDYVFGGRGCEKDLGPLTVTGTVTSANGQRDFTDSGRAEAAGYFKRGVVTFTSGMNMGVSAEIKEHSAGGVFELWPRLAFPILAGVTYSMTPGCTHLKDSSGGCNGCTAWDNLLNYGGADKVPGKDKRAAGANTRAP